MICLFLSGACLPNTLRNFERKSVKEQSFQLSISLNPNLGGLFISWFLGGDMGGGGGGGGVKLPPAQTL